MVRGGGVEVVRGKEGRGGSGEEGEGFGVTRRREAWE